MGGFNVNTSNIHLIFSSYSLEQDNIALPTSATSYGSYNKLLVISQEDNTSVIFFLISNREVFCISRHGSGWPEYYVDGTRYLLYYPNATPASDFPYYRYHTNVTTLITGNIANMAMAEINLVNKTYRSPSNATASYGDYVRIYGIS